MSNNSPQSLRYKIAINAIKNRPGGSFYYKQLLVPETGLEPARREAYAPKAYVYTNFTTRAW